MLNFFFLASLGLKNFLFLPKKMLKRKVWQILCLPPPFAFHLNTQTPTSVSFQSYFCSFCCFQSIFFASDLAESRKSKVVYGVISVDALLLDLQRNDQEELQANWGFKGLDVRRKFEFNVILELHSINKTCCLLTFVQKQSNFLKSALLQTQEESRP